jgi:hypothetical protein
VRSARYTLTGGAFVARDGVVVLPNGASLFIAESEGLEVAYENLAFGPRAPAVPLYWGKLAGGLHLAEHTPMRIAHVRDPAMAAEGSVILARRQLVADVTMTPANARWPVDPVDVTVEIHDPSGRIDPASEPVTVGTLLDLTPLSVAWEHHGTTWHARITPRLIGGNSVVRIIVKDASGDEIGSGFLELASVEDAADGR